MARQISVSIVGDSKSLERAFKRSEASARSFNATIKRSGRETAAAFTGLGRLGPAAAGAGLAAGLKMAVDASREADVVLGQTKVAVTDAGLSWELYGRRVNEAADRISKNSAFDDEDVLRSFQVFVRGQKDVAKSLQLSELAANIARARFTDLDSATQLVSKAAMGQVGALRRAGIQIDSNATAAQALAVLQERFAGAAKTYADSAAGSSDKLRVAWENLAEMAGGPLSKSLASVATELTTIVDMGQKAGAIKLPSLPGMGGGGGTVGGIAAMLTGLITPGVGPSLIGKAINDRFRGRGGGKAPGGGFLGSGLFDDVLSAFQGATSAGGDAVKAVQKQQRQAAANQREAAARGVVNRNTWFDQMINRELVDVQDITGLKGQIKRWQEISAQITARIAVTKDITRKLALEDRVKEIARDIRGNQGEIAAAIKQRAIDDAAALKAAAVAKRAAEATKRAADAAKRAAAVAKRSAATDEKMGWLDFAIERAEATKGTADDRGALRRKEEFLKALIASEGRTLERAREYWETHQKIIDLNKKHTGTTDPLAGLMQVSSAKLTAILAAGTGLSGAGRRVLGANIAGAEIRPLVIHTNVHLDGQVVARSVNTHNARGAHRTASQTSGLR